MNCHICTRELNRADDPLSEDYGGDCWGCVGEIEANGGQEDSLAVVRAEAARGLRPMWVDPFKLETGRSPAHRTNECS